MITKFSSLYAGHVDLGDMGQDSTPAKRSPLLERASHDGVLEDRGDREEYGPARLRHVLAGRAPLPARRLRVHSEHPDGGGASRARDRAPADRLRLQHLPDVAPVAARRGLRHRGHPHRRPRDLRGRTRLPHPGGRDPRRRHDGPGAQSGDVRGAARHHVQGVPQRELSHKGKHYTIPPKLPYRGYELEELTLVPRPKHLPVECWQPIVSASPRGLDFMVKHGIRGIVGGGSALLGEGPVVGYRDALARAGIEAELGEGICVGVNFYLADSQEQAVREATPYYEEHAKMFAPLGFFAGSPTSRPWRSPARRLGRCRLPDHRPADAVPLVVLRHRGGDDRLSARAPGASSPGSRPSTCSRAWARRSR